MSHVVAVNRLSTVEFHAAVYALSPKVAVFDCDGTLWSGDAGSAFMNWTVETGLVSREATDWIDTRYRGYLKGDVRYKDRAIVVFDQLEAACKEGGTSCWFNR